MSLMHRFVWRGFVVSAQILMVNQAFHRITEGCGLGCFDDQQMLVMSVPGNVIRGNRARSVWPGLQMASSEPRGRKPLDAVRERQ